MFKTRGFGGVLILTVVATATLLADHLGFKGSTYPSAALRGLSWQRISMTTGKWISLPPICCRIR